MSDKLGQSLDEIVKDRRQAVRRPRNPRRAVNGGRIQGAVSAPVGGVRKVAKPTKGAPKATIPSTASGSGDSKIIVSNLPADVTEQQIKEYFGKTIGPVKRASLTYGPNGQSRGITTITFLKAASAAEAAKSLDGVKVDGRPMKIEVVVGAKEAPAPLPAKTLGQRISKPKLASKAEPKPATSTRTAPGSTRGGAKRGRGRGGRTVGRGKPKTAEELDAEMQDYFDGGASGAPDGGEAAAAGTNGAAVGDTGMEDEVL